MIALPIVLGMVFGLITYVGGDGVTDPLLWFIWGNTLAGLWLLSDIRDEVRKRADR